MYIRKYVQKAVDKAAYHRVNPIIFVVLYLFTIPLIGLSLVLPININDKFMLAIGLYLAPWLYLMLIGVHVSWYIRVVIFFIVSIGVYIRFNVYYGVPIAMILVLANWLREVQTNARG